MYQETEVMVISRHKKSRKQDEQTTKMLMLTAFLSLVSVLIDLIDKIISLATK